MKELSIVLGTFNRFGRLRGLIDSVRENVGRSYEIVVADGGSTDGSREWLAEQPDVVLIGERSLLGAVNAYNKAFRMSSGRYVAHLNDDCVLLDDILDDACDILDGQPSVGEVALPFVDVGGKPIVNYINMNGTSVLYANFGVLRRDLGNQVGWWGDYLYTYGGDCELSFNIWASGYRVVAFSGKHVHHYRERDELRDDIPRSDEFFKKWRHSVEKTWQ